MMFWLEESENILADDPIVQYVYICALKRDSASDWVAYCTHMRMIGLVITYCAVCPHLLPDGITYCTIICHDSIYGYAHSLFNTVNNPSSLFPIPIIHAMKSYDIVPEFHVCKHILSTYCK